MLAACQQIKLNENAKNFTEEKKTKQRNLIEKGEKKRFLTNDLKQI